MSDVGFRMSDVGMRMLESGYWNADVGMRMLDDRINSLSFIKTFKPLRLNTKTYLKWIK